MNSTVRVRARSNIKKAKNYYFHVLLSGTVPEDVTTCKVDLPTSRRAVKSLNLAQAAK